jgi:hypothetical protein
MPARAFHFTFVPVDGGAAWHVRRAGRFIGTIEERGGGYQATRPPGETAPTRRFVDRVAAAEWLGKLASEDERA